VDVATDLEYSLLQWFSVGNNRLPEIVLLSPFFSELIVQLSINQSMCQ
jgi:hypothetical protein